MMRCENRQDSRSRQVKTSQVPQVRNYCCPRDGMDVLYMYLPEVCGNGWSKRAWQTRNKHYFFFSVYDRPQEFQTQRDEEE